MKFFLVYALKVGMGEGVSGESLTVCWSRLRGAGLYSTPFCMALYLCHNSLSGDPWSLAYPVWMAERVLNHAVEADKLDAWIWQHELLYRQKVSVFNHCTVEEPGYENCSATIVSATMSQLCRCLHCRYLLLCSKLSTCTSIHAVKMPEHWCLQVSFCDYFFSFFSHCELFCFLTVVA